MSYIPSLSILRNHRYLHIFFSCSAHATIRASFFSFNFFFTFLSILYMLTIFSSLTLLLSPPLSPVFLFPWRTKCLSKLIKVVSQQCKMETKRYWSLILGKSPFPEKELSDRLLWIWWLLSCVKWRQFSQTWQDEEDFQDRAIAGPMSRWLSDFGRYRKQYGSSTLGICLSVDWAALTLRKQ